MAAPMIAEGFVLRLPDGDIMLAFDEWPQFDPVGKLRQRRLTIQHDLHAPVIA